MVWDIACASKILWMPIVYFWYSVYYSYVSVLFVNYSYVSVFFACVNYSYGSACWSGGSQLFVSCVSSADLNNSTE